MTASSKPPAVLVTGVSSGIGLAIAEDLLAQGYRVFGSVRRLADAQTLVERGGTAFVPLLFDVTDEAGLAQAVRTLETALQGETLSALVNNAGISLAGPLVLQPMEEIRQVFEINVFGLLAVTRAFLPLLQARQAGAKAGRVINIGSVSGAITVPFMGAYSASKHALEAITQGLRRELMPYGIHATVIEPNFIRTSMFIKNKLHSQANPYSGSPYADVWQQFNASLVRQEASAKPARVVTAAVRHALQSPRPRTRYPLDALWYIGRCLPDRVFDRLIFKALGIAAMMTSSSSGKS